MTRDLSLYNQFLELCENRDVRIGMLYSSKKLAELLGVTPATLCRMRNDGRGPAFTQMVPGGDIRYTHEAVMEWIQSLPSYQSTAELYSPR